MTCFVEMPIWYAAYGTYRCESISRLQKYSTLTLGTRQRIINVVRIQCETCVLHFMAVH